MSNLIKNSSAPNVLSMISSTFGIGNASVFISLFSALQSMQNSVRPSLFSRFTTWKPHGFWAGGRLTILAVKVSYISLFAISVYLDAIFHTGIMTTWESLSYNEWQYGTPAGLWSFMLPATRYLPSNNALNHSSPWFSTEWRSAIFNASYSEAPKFFPPSRFNVSTSSPNEMACFSSIFSSFSSDEFLST